MTTHHPLRATTALAVTLALGASLASSQPAFADSTQDEILLLKQQIELLSQKLEALASKQAAQEQKAAAAPGKTSGGHGFLEPKDGKDVTFYTKGGEITAYGNLDLSVDSTSKGIGGFIDGNGNQPQGNMGWMPAVSTNLSFFGLRGFQNIAEDGYKFVWQLETQIDVSATSGLPQTNSNQSNTVKGALTSRNSFIGLATDAWGAIKIGKTDAPYKNSTARMNPFSGMLGDYQVIMGNSGGDNRVEFSARMDHALWFESPDWNGIKLAALFAPGQNRATDSSNIPSGESDCAGGNIPGSGGLPALCADGSFSNALSVSLSYEQGPLLITGAYELHHAVNRSSDLSTLVDGVTPVPASYSAADVADEAAAKIGAQYAFPTGTTVSAIYERMTRDLPGYLSYQNERQRNGTWLALSQDLGAGNTLHLGWAHADKTPGDPGQHNSAITANPDNPADMYTFAAIHQVDRNLSYYFNYAETHNTALTHYDLGAGGHGLTTDCHDAGAAAGGSGQDVTGGPISNPHCWAGGHLKGVSLGMKYKF
jgi:predicted porin